MHVIWKKNFPFAVILFLAACGDSSSGSEDTSAYESVLDLPNCTALNFGEEAYVKSEKTTYVCTGVKWVVVGPSSENSNSDTGSNRNDATSILTDLRDGRTYKTVTIASQEWMAENLNYEVANSYCYDDEPENCDTYGRLYAWSAAMEACPKGWHLPDFDELMALVEVLGGEKVAGGRLKSTSGWLNFERENGNGTDDFGFSALPAGGYCKGLYCGQGEMANFWSSTEDDDIYVRGISLLNGTSNARESLCRKNNAYSVRCIKD